MFISTGTRLGRYEIRSPLGAGGMGEVYLAWDTQLDRTVALKVLPADVAGDQQRMRRFLQEAKAVSAVNHPNILTIFEIGQAGSVQFIATEFIDGVTLRQRMASTGMPLSEVLDVAIQVADALAAAHAAGTVHRDIKPENIMLRCDSFVKILDFGLAKLTEQQAIHSEATTLVKTIPGVVLGTTTYMSPEQARGLEVDARSDIWSLGVVLYEMITGQAPFTGATASDVIASILERKPPALTTYRPEIPEALEWVTMKALRKDREERYQTAKDLAVDLRQLRQKSENEAELKQQAQQELHGGKVTANRGGQAAVEVNKESAQNSSQSNRTATAARKRPSRTAINSLAILPLVNQSADPDAEYLSDGITESIINSLSQIPKLRVMARSTVFRYKGRETDPQRVGREVGVRAVLTGRVLQPGDRLIIGVELVDVTDGSQLWGEQYNRRSSDIFAVQEEISREISEKLRLRLTGKEKKRLTKRHTESTEAYHAFLKGRYFKDKWTQEGVKKGIEYFEQAIEIDPIYALAYVGLADCYIALCALSVIPSKEGYPKARAAVTKALEIDDTLPEAHISLAKIKEAFDWDWPGAEREFKHAIELNPNYPTAHLRYGRYLLWMGRFDESMAEIKRAYELDPLSPIINTNLSLPLLFTRQYDRCIESLRGETVQMHPNFFLVHSSLGMAYERKGMYEEAITELQKAMELSGSNTDIYCALGYVYAVSDRKEKAQDILNQVEELSKQSYVSPSSIAMIYTGLRDKDQAFAWLQKAYEERDVEMECLKVDPVWDSLRSDPRFADLLWRIGLAA